MRKHRAIISKTKDGVEWVKVYNAGGTSVYEPGYHFGSPR